MSKDEIKEKDEVIRLRNKFDDSLERMALEKFSEALYTKDRKKSYLLAIEAYELNPLEYNYKVYAISKLDDNLEKEKLYLDLIDSINKDINNGETSLYNFYNKDEIYKKRYKALVYNYIICLLINKKYILALDELIKFDSIYSHYDYKVRHLILNLFIVLNKYEEINKYFILNEKEECILNYLPMAYYLYKNGETEKSIDYLKRIIRNNKYFYEILINLDKNEYIEEIKKSKERYKLRSREEALFCFKYFYFIYSTDSDFINLFITFRGLYEENI